MVNCVLWWNGPDLLGCRCHQISDLAEWNSRNKWSFQKSALFLSTTTKKEKFNIWEKYSTFDRLHCVVAWCKRFAASAQRRERKDTRSLSSSDMEPARRSLLRISQRMSYPSELETLSKGKALPISNSLLSIHPLLGKGNLIRVRGRL